MFCTANYNLFDTVFLVSSLGIRCSSTALKPIFNHKNIFQCTCSYLAKLQPCSQLLRLTLYLHSSLLSKLNYILYALYICKFCLWHHAILMLCINWYDPHTSWGMGYERLAEPFIFSTFNVKTNKIRFALDTSPGPSRALIHVCIAVWLLPCWKACLLLCGLQLQGLHAYRILYMLNSV